mmetsp:Transcript_5981/g.12105  ORF Transcript_5981/g.12105 Transcript_5981/m.12105 type:complete len:251 (-) Transcript_5981:101-853(-)
MKPSLTSCFFRNASLYRLRSSMIPVMSISLYVVRIAAVFWESLRRSAMRRRMRLMGTRRSMRSDPPEADGGSSLAGGGGVGLEEEGGGGGGGDEEAAGGAFSSAAAGAGFESAELEDAPPVAPLLYLTRSAPTSTVSPSWEHSSVITPPSGARISTVTLSVSTSHRISSISTWSPTFLCQATIVPSEMESPMAGTGITAASPPVPAHRRGLAKLFKCNTRRFVMRVAELDLKVRSPATCALTGGANLVAD